MATKERPPKSSSLAASSAAQVAMQHAVDAVVWGTPIVSFDAMRKAFFRDAGAAYNDIVFWSEVADWRLQIATPNASAHYVYLNFNTKDGPVVLDIPAAIGAGMS